MQAAPVCAAKRGHVSRPQGKPGRTLALVRHDKAQTPRARIGILSHISESVYTYRQRYEQRYGAQKRPAIHRWRRHRYPAWTGRWLSSTLRLFLVFKTTSAMAS